MQTRQLNRSVNNIIDVSDWSSRPYLRPATGAARSASYVEWLLALSIEYYSDKFSIKYNKCMWNGNNNFNFLYDTSLIFKVCQCYFVGVLFSRSISNKSSVVIRILSKERKSYLRVSIASEFVLTIMFSKCDAESNI